MGRYIKENLSKEYIMQKFEPDQLVLVRHGDGWPWRLRRYSLFDGTRHETQDGNVWYDECILPYAGNEYMLGTTVSATSAWQPKLGELVAVSDTGEENEWEPCIYNGRSGDTSLPYKARKIQGEVCNWRFCEPIRDHFTIPEE